MVNLALLILRLILGLIIAAHGAQKLFGWFGGEGLAGTTQMMVKLSVHPPKIWAIIASVNEFAGGLLTALGLLMPLGPLLIIANMLSAGVLVHFPNGFWNSKRGHEYPLMLGAAACSLGLAGAGPYSLDALLRFQIQEPRGIIVGIIAVLIGFVIMLASDTRVVQTIRQGRAHQAR